MLEVLQGFDKPGTVLLLSDAIGEVNTAIRDPFGTWALGGKADPHTDEKVASGIEVADLCVSVIHEGGTLHHE
jgi:hypothetical protein